MGDSLMRPIQRHGAGAPHAVRQRRVVLTSVPICALLHVATWETRHQVEDSCPGDGLSNCHLRVVPCGLSRRRGMVDEHFYRHTAYATSDSG